MSSQASEASAQLDPENDQDWYKLAQQEMLAAGRADREEESRRRRA